VVEGVKHAEVLLEALGVRGVKENPPLERFAADLLQRDRRARAVFGQALLGGFVENAHAVVDAEDRLFSGQEGSGQVFVQQLVLHQDLDHTTPENLGHQLEPREGDVEEGALLIKTSFQHDCVEVGVEAEHVSKGLVSDDHSAENGRNWAWLHLGLVQRTLSRRPGGRRHRCRTARRSD
jgi:hypothetical protein